MSLYDNCADCKGYGYFRCVSCVCKSCEASGKTKCTHCKDGKEPCYSCGATGQIELKGWIFSSYEVCPRCRGNKTIPCSICKGSRTVNCPSCNGKGRTAQCARCGGTQKITCQSCSGSGKVVSQWFKSLNDFPVERLRFEYEKKAA